MMVGETVIPNFFYNHTSMPEAPEQQLRHCGEAVQSSDPKRGSSGITITGFCSYCLSM